ncbi:MAG TPA: hypothetical protein H9761_14030 [Candidatus Eisenbergiella merdavium]|uniref:LD-carboxypeptidase C-terminal domain-containing protein n=1 Tax=Candidatus Eisenbergiella merdavium TaxID=2838551 RepID=A0A9D2NHI1_9FIRM|nr:hypothetical protein [Candidatus Eisenbergiella merdavium]
MKNVSGLLFGHYSSGEGDSFRSLQQLLELLERFGKRHGIPVAYCDDFGHGDRHALLPVGRKARLDADRQLLQF